MAKVACCQTGNEQLEFLFGENDSNQWRENYASSVTGSKVVKPTTSFYGYPKSWVIFTKSLIIVIRHSFL
jgi:hypothetical protein